MNRQVQLYPLPTIPLLGFKLYLNWTREVFISLWTGCKRGFKPLLHLIWEGFNSRLNGRGSNLSFLGRTRKGIKPPLDWTREGFGVSLDWTQEGL